MAANALKYFFTVLYLDGSIYQQNEQDVSAIDPTRSCFTDATHKIQDGKFALDDQGNLVSRMDEIHRFLIQLRDSPEESQQSYMVDMVTGHFEVNCIPFRFHDSEQQFVNRKLIFFRRHYHLMTMGTTGVVPNPERHSISFRLGWQATEAASGKMVQHVMEVD